MTKMFERFAAEVVKRHDRLMDEGPDEQAARVVARLTHFAKSTPLVPVIGTMLSLANFGQAALYFASQWDEYFLLSEAAESLGWPIHKAAAWAEREHLDALRDQRETDEERGDHLLGYESVRNYVDLRIFAIVDDPEAKPDASGKRWSLSGDWLIAKDRVFAMILDSPWSKEFMDNTQDLMRHAFKDTMGGFPGLEPELSKDEALRRARRGPVMDDSQDGGDRG